MQDVIDAVGRLGLEESVLLIGGVPDTDLPALYSAASVFVLPSLYEGFGLPLLEAMACGTPIACANSTSLPEVAGDAAVFFDPLDVAAMADAIAGVLTDEALAESLRARGFARVANYTWDQTAQKTVAVYREVLSQASDAIHSRRVSSAEQRADS
jgi:glycosyltransferase involved in cell wall biosynthesis